MMLAGSVFAGEWTKPTAPASSPAVIDGATEQYLYNVGAGAFFLGANDWNTRASVSTSKGYKVKLTSTGETTISITDYVETQNAWKKTFVDGLAGIWVDNNNGANADAWVIEALEGDQFKLTNNAFPGYYLGKADNYNGNTEDTRLYMSNAEDTLTNQAAFHDVWVCVSAEDYAGFAVDITRYNTAMELKAAIEDAEAQYPGIDLAAEHAVLDNTESTLEQLQDALASVDAKVKAAAKEAAENSASVSNPVDLSSMIVNATFDEIGDFHGWSGTAFGAGGTRDKCAEHYNKTYNTWQEIEGLPNGVYALSANAFYRAGSGENALAEFKAGVPTRAYLYAYNVAATGADTVAANVNSIFYGIEPGDETLGGGVVVDGDFTYHLPNSMADAVKCFEAGHYADNVVLFAVSEGKAHIGVYKNVNVGSTDWSIFDNFKLTYYGKAGEAYQMWMTNYIQNLADYSSIEYVTGSVVEAYKAVVAAHATATTQEQVLANIAAIKESAALVDANVAAWKELLNAVAEAKKVVNNDKLSGPMKDDLGDYLELDVQDVLDAKELSTEDVLALAAEINQMVVDVLLNCVAEDTDFTEWLKNPNFTTNDGWQGNPVINTAAKCAESWNQSSFDIYQIKEGAPAGVYQISMQGFYRELRGENAWKLCFEPEFGDPLPTKPASKAYVYLNDAKSPLMNVFDYQVPTGELYTTTGSLAPYTDPLGTYWYPNDMSAAGQAFDEGAYVMSAFGLVSDGEPMRIGVKGCTNTGGDSWAIFTRFKLIYRGFNADVIRPILEEKLATLSADDLMGVDVKAKVADAIAQGQQALGSDNGRAMFEVLSAIYKIEDEIAESKALFQELVEAVSAFYEFIGSADAVAPDAVKAEAIAYVESVESAMPEMTNADAKEAVAKIAEWTALCRVPEMEASDENPFDATGVIASSGFDNGEGGNSIAGWTYDVAPNFGNDATQKSALAVEYYEKTYNIYQDLVGLPAGTYTVGVNAFFRNGSTDQDFATVAEEENGLAKMYAVTTSNVYEKYVALLASDPSLEKLGYGAELEHTDAEGNTVYIPNDMVSAAAYFDEGHYLNTITLEVGEDGKLRIGMKQEDKITSCWMIMDNWTLTYYGADSQKELDGIESVATSVANVEFFNINGQKIAAPQMGVNILRATTASGNVIVRKIIVK